MSHRAKASEIIKRIIPWALEKNVSQHKYRTNYKGNRGRIGIVGGARDYSGAPYFASISAMRLGADLAYVICSEGASQSIKNYSPDLIVTPLLDCPDDKKFEEEMSCLLDRLHALVIGPGLGREPLLQRRAKSLIVEAKLRSLPVILDADSLILVNNDRNLIQSYPKALLTPNRIELQRMLQNLYGDSDLNDLRKLGSTEIRNLVAKCSKDLGVTILAKGMVDMINNEHGIDLVTDETLGSNRRCGGQGDIIAGLAAVYAHWIDQVNKESPDNIIENPQAWAGYLATVTTRKCNELAFRDYRNGMLASHMIEKIHIVLDNIVNEASTQGSSDMASNYAGSLTFDEINRYARQMILDGFGPEQQLRLKKASAVIIGAGGLGCPSSAYLAAAGIGTLGIVDNDRVEASNLHRQILHGVDRIGMLKTESIKKAISVINPNVNVQTHSVRFTRENAVQLVENYDIVIDATDNLLTRYIISDACVVAKKPLISGAALRTDGQLTVYNYDKDTPCFRCLFPEPPKAVGSCSENGVLGMIPGIIGVHQALEAMKLAVGMRPSYAGSMYLFDGLCGTFRQIKIVSRRPNCESCGKESKLDRSLIDYENFCPAEPCRSQPNTDILSCEERISTEQYRDILISGEPHVLIDVRPKAHSDASRFKHALQVPLDTLMRDPGGSLALIQAELKAKDTDRVYVVCRRGIASQRGTKIIKELLASKQASDSHATVQDIRGGMTGWAKFIDSSFFCV